MQRKTTRVAGALYLLSAVTAGVPLMYVSSRLIVPDDAAKTAGNILASEASFRVCMVSELIGAITFTFVNLACVPLPQLPPVSKSRP